MTLWFDVPDAELASDQLEAVRGMLNIAAMVDDRHERTHALWCLAAALAIAGRNSGLSKEDASICFIAALDNVHEIMDQLGPDATVAEILSEEHCR